MRRMLSGLILVPLLAFSNVSDVAAQSTDSDGVQRVQSVQTPKKNNKQISGKRGSKTPSSLNAAEAYAVGHSDALPISSSSKPPTTQALPAPASPAPYSWTGFHIGAGIGAGMQ